MNYELGDDRENEHQVRHDNPLWAAIKKAIKDSSNV